MFDAGQTVDSMQTKDLTQMRGTMRKMSVKSSYNNTFGDRPREEAPHNIVRRKKLSEMDFCSILKPEPLRMIERWITGGSEEEFIERAFSTLRAMYTVVRGKIHHSTT